MEMAISAKIAAKQKRQGSSLTEDELDVAEILIELQYLLKSRPLLFFCWGSKKKRSSSIDSKTTPSTTSLCNAEKTHFRVEAASPATPLSFSPSEIDSKFKQPRRRIFKKKNNKELRDIVTALSVQHEQLKFEVSKMRDYYDKLRAVNLQLKARQEAPIICQPSEPAVEEKQAPIIHQPSEPATEEKQAPTIHQPSESSTVNATTVIGNFRYPHVEMSHLSESCLSFQSKHYPYSRLDMNLFADEAASNDFQCKAAIAAQARKRRIEINRVKSSMSLKRPRLR